MVSRLRILADLTDIEKNPPSHVSAGLLNEDNIYEWEATIMGPSLSPYAGGIFKLLIQFPDTYPFKAPHIKFKTKLYHPNIDFFGNICLDILTTKWSPAMKLSKILLSITSLLDDPNPDDPLNKEAANLFIDDIESYNKKARLYTLNHAI